MEVATGCLWSWGTCCSLQRWEGGISTGPKPDLFVWSVPAWGDLFFTLAFVYFGLGLSVWLYSLFC